MTEINRGGRPPAESPRTKAHMLRLTEEEDALVREAAGDARPAVWMREQALNAARKARRRA